MSFKISFDAIGRSIVLRAHTSELSQRDKCQLLRDLMDDLGLTHEINLARKETPHEMKEFDKIYSACIERNWK